MKPHEEDWLAAGARVIAFQGEHTVPNRAVAMSMRFDDAKLIAQAPAMARLLESLGAMACHDERGNHAGRYFCSWCLAESSENHERTEAEALASVPHLPDCRLIAVLKAAGVVE